MGVETRGVVKGRLRTWIDSGNESLWHPKLKGRWYTDEHPLAPPPEVLEEEERCPKKS